MSHPPQMSLEVLGRQEGDLHLDLPQVENPFTLGGRGTLPLPPAGVPLQWGDPKDGISTHPTSGIPGTTTQGPPQPQAARPAPTTHYSGMATAITKWGTGDNGTQSVELRWQQGVAGDKTKITQFQEVAGALQEFKTYLFMKPGSAFCTIVHSPMKFGKIGEYYSYGVATFCTLHTFLFSFFAYHHSFSF
jgi:hypothetical protein